MNTLKPHRRSATPSIAESMVNFCCALLPGPAKLLLALSMVGLSPSILASEAIAERVELCVIQARVDSLIAQIEWQHAAIRVQEESVQRYPGRYQHTGFAQRISAYLGYVAQWSMSQADIASRYLKIGSLETSLLVAYSRLSAAKQAWHESDTRGACCVDSQLREEASMLGLVASEL